MSTTFPIGRSNLPGTLGAGTGTPSACIGIPRTCTDTPSTYIVIPAQAGILPSPDTGHRPNHPKRSLPRRAKAIASGQNRPRHSGASPQPTFAGYRPPAKPLKRSPTPPGQGYRIRAKLPPSFRRKPAATACNHPLRSRLSPPKPGLPSNAKAPARLTIDG